MRKFRKGDKVTLDKFDNHLVGKEFHLVSDEYIDADGNKVAKVNKLGGSHIYNICHFTLIKGNFNMKDKALSLYNKVKPYEKYLFMAAAIYCIDYFLFDGKYSDKLKNLASRLVEGLESKIDAGLTSIFGGRGE